MVSEDPDTAFPCDAFQSTLGYKALHLEGSAYNQANLLTPLYFHDYLSQQPPWIQHLLHRWESANPEAVSDILQRDKESVIVSYGGLSQGEAFGALSRLADIDVMELSGGAPGCTKLHCSFRNEAFGMCWQVFVSFNIYLVSSTSLSYLTAK
jgi:hypothetical protein